jgi:hypothetical protein
MPAWMTTAKLVQSAAKISHWPYTDQEVDAEMEHVRLGCADGGYGRVWVEGRESHPMALMESKSTSRAGECLLGGMGFFDPQPWIRSHSHPHPRLGQHLPRRLEGTPKVRCCSPWRDSGPEGDIGSRQEAHGKSQSIVISSPASSLHSACRGPVALTQLLLILGPFARKIMPLFPRGNAATGASSERQDGSGWCYPTCCPFGATVCGWWVASPTTSRGLDLAGSTRDFLIFRASHPG